MRTPARPLRVVVVAILVLAGVTLLPVLSPGRPGFQQAQAAGHGGLVATDPVAGSTVTIAPLFVRLDFGHTLLDLGVAVRVRGPNGAVVSSGPPRLYPTTVTQSLSGDLPAGRYQVSWRVTGEDGLPLAGQFVFTTQASGSASVAPAALPRPSTPPAARTTSVGSSGSGPGFVGLEVGAVAAVIALAVAVAALRRRARRRVGQVPVGGSR